MPLLEKVIGYCPCCPSPTPIVQFLFSFYFPTIIVIFNDKQLNQRTNKGQDTDQTGNGKIVNTKDYVLDKYGSGYSLVNSHSLDMDLYLQSDLSVYKTIEQDGQAYSEGNCWIVSAFHVLQYLAKTKYTDMYSDDIVTYDAKNEEPDIYSKHFDNNGNCKETKNFSS